MTDTFDERVAMLRRYYDALNRHDVEAVVDFFHPEADFYPMPASLPPPGTHYHGRAGIRSLYHGMFARMGNVRIHVHEIRDLGDRLLSRFTSAWDDGAVDLVALYMFKDGKINRVDGFGTEEEALEAARVQSEDQFRQLFQHASDAVVLTDDDARFVDANPSACQLYSTDVRELRDRTLFDFFPDELVPAARQDWWSFLKGDQFSRRSEIAPAQGERRPVELRGKLEFVPGRHLVIVTERMPGDVEDRANGSIERRLTAREREVFRLLALGFTGAEVAERLVLSPYTVRRHVEKGVARLGAKNRVQAIAIAITTGEIQL